MWSVIPMTDKFYAMEIEDTECLDDLHYNAEEMERLSVFLSEGRAVILVNDLEDLHSLRLPIDVEVVSKDEED